MWRKKVLVLLTVIVLTAVGFGLGQLALAAGEGPGTQTDPLVTKSYIDAEVGKLQVQIDALKADVEKLKAR